MPKKHRDYDNKYPSVTQILNVLRKPGLEQWFLSNTREYCNRMSKAGKQAGTDTHNAIQQYIENGIAKIESAYPDEVSNALNSFILFRKENPDILLSLSEVALTSEKYKYNGTIDAPHPPMLGDWKTSNCKDKDKPDIYPEYKTQVAGYVYLWNENYPEKPIENAYIVALAKDKVAYNLYKMDRYEIEDEFNCMFLSSLTIWNYQHKKKGK